VAEELGLRRVSGTAPQFTATSLPRRRESACRARAATSLPVPVSPRKVTGTAVAATRTSASSCSRSATTKVRSGGPLVDVVGEEVGDLGADRRDRVAEHEEGVANLEDVPVAELGLRGDDAVQPGAVLGPGVLDHPAAADGHQPRVLLRHARVRDLEDQLLDAAGGLAPRVRRRPPPELDDVDAVEEVAAGRPEGIVAAQHDEELRHGPVRVLATGAFDQRLAGECLLPPHHGQYNA